MARADSDDQKNVIAYSIVGDTLVLMEGSILEYNTQLQSFSASSFADNDLCGAPHPNCIEKNVLVRDDENGKGNEDEDEDGDGIDRLFYISMALGFVVGFWCFIGSLLINRR
ncbi:hypothetical protein WN944_002078 [Citrus x changshan-huyou]|uniref:Uncharacterized protein n=1 Tax=Citrus x changshan-huyou TaxID=2935761 RepID=A0AAP0QS24_9ROSI